MPDLKSCPFCGLAAQRGTGAALGFARCVDGDCPAHNWATIDRWNTRAPAPPSEGIREVVAASVAAEHAGHIFDAHLVSASSDAWCSAIAAHERLVSAVRAMKPAEREACGVSREPFALEKAGRIGCLDD